MKQAKQFQWVELTRDVPNSLVKKGDRGVVLEHLKPTNKQPQPGYILEVFQEGETLDVIYIPISWVKILPDIWGDFQHSSSAEAIPGRAISF